MGSIYKPKYKDRDGETRESAVYWIKYYKNGRPIRESSGSSKHEDAKRLLKIREGRAAQGLPLGIHLEKVTFKELSQDYLNWYQINKLRSLTRAKELVGHLSKFFEDDRVIEITTDRVRAYAAQRKKEKGRKGPNIANGTINRELGALKRMLNLGLQAGKVGRIPHIEMLQENNVRSGYFEHEEFLALNAALPDYAKVPVTIAYYTGMRAGEILNLRWDQVNLIEGKILLSSNQTKNKTPRMVYLTGELYGALLTARANRDRDYPDCPWVCQRLGERLQSFKKAWQTALETAKLEGRLFHDFRRTAVRNMVRAGIPEKVAMSISGHKTRSVFDRYNIVSESDLKTAAERISRYHLAVTGKVTGKVAGSEAILEEVCASK